MLLEGSPFLRRKLVARVALNHLLLCINSIHPCCPVQPVIELTKVSERAGLYESDALAGDAGAPRNFVGRQLFVEMHAQ